MSELRAFKPVSTAFEKTKKVLLDPFDAWLWLKLVVIMFFVGSGGSSSFNPGNALQYTSDNDGAYPPGTFSWSDLLNILADPVVLGIIAAVLLLIVAIVLLFSYLRGVFSFVLIEGLTSGNVHIIRPFVDNMGRGFKAFLFNLAVIVVTVAFFVVLLGIMLLAIYSFVQVDSGGPASIPLVLLMVGILLVALFAFVVFAVVCGLIVGFFYDFAVPLMFFKNAGLKEPIGQVVGLVKKEPLEFLVYVIVRWLIELAAGFVFGIANLCVMAAFIVAGIILVLVGLAAMQISWWFVVPLAILLVIGIIMMVIVMSIVTMPLRVYLRYYSLDFLKSFDTSYVNYSGRMA